MADSPILTGFDADAFRTAITNTMIMGLPVEPAQQPIFYFRNAATYPTGTKVDSEGRAIDARIKPTLTPAHVPVSVPCAIEWGLDTTNNEGMVGTMWTDRATLTLLDTAYTQVQDAIEVDLGGRRFLIQKVVPLALGTVGVFQLQVFLKGTAND
jgi:hypothetical protein